MATSEEFMAELKEREYQTKMVAKLAVLKSEEMLEGVRTGTVAPLESLKAALAVGTTMVEALEAAIAVANEEGDSARMPALFLHLETNQRLSDRMRDVITKRIERGG